MHPIGVEVVAVSGLNRIECRVNEWLAECYLVQIGFIESQKDAVFVGVKCVVDAAGVLKSISRIRRCVIGDARHLQIARYGHARGPVHGGERRPASGTTLSGLPGTGARDLLRGLTVIVRI